MARLWKKPCESSRTKCCTNSTNYDLQSLETLIDQAELLLEEHFPEPGDVQYADSDEPPNFHFELDQWEDGKYDCYVSIPFSNPKYDSVTASFSMEHVRESHSVRLDQVSTRIGSL